jgi:hypothetical protein
VLLTFALLWIAEDAPAHTFKPGACYAASDRPACAAYVRRHIAAHHRQALVDACLAVRGSGMGRALCTAIIDVRPAWGTNRALHELLRRESTWNLNAVNESGGACGAFQRQPCPWSSYGGTSSPLDDRVYASAATQARNGIGNIASRYGTPERALAAHDAQGWY